MGADASITQLYAGCVAVVALLWLGIARGGLVSAGSRFPAIVLFVSLVYALGNGTPIFGMLHSTVAGVDLFRRPADATFILNLALSLVVLATTDRYVKSGLAGAPGRSDLAGAALFVTLLGLAVAAAWSHGRLNQAMAPISLSLVITIVIVGLLLAGRNGGKNRRRWILWALVAVTALDLGHFTVGTWLNAQDPKYYSVLERPEDDDLARAIRDQAQGIEAKEGPIRVEMLGFGGAWHNLSMVIGVENTLGYNPARNGSYVRATGAKQNSNAPLRSFGAQMTGYRSPLADLLGLRLIVLRRPMEEIDPASAAAFPTPTRLSRAWIYENPRAVPRAVLIAEDHALPLAPGQAKGSEALPDLDWSKHALIDGAPPTDTQSQELPGLLRIASYRAGDMRLELEVKRPSWLVIHELRQPGWEVRVDGKPRPLVPANGLFQAVKVFPDDARAEKRFGPPWWVMWPEFGDGK